MRIAILHDTVPTGAPASTVEAAQLALRDLGHAPVRIHVTGALDEWSGRLAEAGAELVFNLCTGDAAPHITAIVEMLGLPLTGSGAETLFLTRRRDRVSAVLRAMSLEVSAWRPLVASAGGSIRARLPLRVLPAAAGAIGDDGAWGTVIEDEAALATLLASAPAPLLGQALGPGRHFSVGIVGERVLPISENERPGVAEDGAGAGSPFPAPTLIDAALAVAREAWRAVQGRGYGRIDMLAGGVDAVRILDVTANPALSPGAALTRMAAVNGWGYTDLLGRIVEAAEA